MTTKQEKCGQNGHEFQDRRCIHCNLVKKFARAQVEDAMAQMLMGAFQVKSKREVIREMSDGESNESLFDMCVEEACDFLDEFTSNLTDEMALQVACVYTYYKDFNG